MSWRLGCKIPQAVIRRGEGERERGGGKSYALCSRDGRGPCLGIGRVSCATWLWTAPAGALQSLFSLSGETEAQRVSELPIPSAPGQPLPYLLCP